MGEPGVRRGEIRWYTFRLPDKRRPVMILARNLVLTHDDGTPVTCALNFDHISLAQQGRMGPLNFSHEGNLDDPTRIRLEYQVPGADDIHYAPDLHALVATTATSVIAYAVGPDGLREVARIGKKKSETPVLVEWAYGDLVERWDKELHSIASREFPTPEIRLRKE